MESAFDLFQDLWRFSPRLRCIIAVRRAMVLCDVISRHDTFLFLLTIKSWMIH